ncbi:hypothetical protein CI793_09610 [Anoxybacillus ayderensis]|uniref:tail fiber protein n=1 Tax=Anoxybacillus sp. ST70 TaxID=2864180 RepID=UPI000311A37D|nr:tail fiber protein [Anoxybacillus sp. ST70]AXM89394.1 hypothetical protein B379_09775 [Anoxybacillus ayderensis G10]MBW9219415.1 phage tail protein [Anoxybacillus sp. ST70]THD16155.1 hypothetical protein CI793_09610 [Anoxybacillus ayderensis]
MASNTPRLGLYKKDPIADANDTFNIQTMLNDNWDKIDGKVAILGPDGKILSEQLPQQSLPTASTTQAGIVKLNTSTNSTSTSEAATPSAVKEVNDALAAHSADYVKHPADGGTTGGTATAYTCSSNPAPTALVDKMGIVITVHVDSGANPTLNWNNLGAKPIKKPNGNAAVLKAGGIYTLRYNAISGNFILQGEGGGGTAQPADVLSGKTFTNDSGEQTGIMPNRGAITITPSTIDQTIPDGYHNGSGIVKGDPDLIPSNIRQGVNIFGVTGTLVEGKRWASGTVSITNNNSVSVTGLAFNPKYVLCYISSKGQVAGNFNGNSSLFSIPSTNMYQADSRISLVTGGFIVSYSQNVTIDWIAFE